VVLASIVPQTLTVLAFGTLALLAWVARRRFPALSILLWLLLGIDLVFVAWFVVAAWGCRPGACKNDQAAVIIVWMVALDALLVALFIAFAAIGGVVAVRRRWRERGERGA